MRNEAHVIRCMTLVAKVSCKVEKKYSMELFKNVNNSWLFLFIFFLVCLQVCCACAYLKKHEVVA